MVVKIMPIVVNSFPFFVTKLSSWESISEIESKKTYAQTCAFSNLDMKNVGNYLSLLRQVGLVPHKVALISQSIGCFRWLLMHGILQTLASRIAKMAKWCLSACWENLHVFKLYELTDLVHCISLKAIGKVSYQTALLFQCATTSLSIYCTYDVSK